MFGITKANGIYTITSKKFRTVYTTKSLWVAIQSKIIGW